jgi:transcriptional regulator with GAF, ATPase, and Fis domain
LTQPPPDAIRWDDVRELHVVRKLSEILRRRWGLTVALAGPDGRPGIPQAPPLAPSAACRAVQAVPAGERACSEAAAELGRRAADPAAGLPSRTTCHAGLGLCAAPIVVAGKPAGLVWTGGFAVDDTSAGRFADRLVALRVDRDAARAAVEGLQALPAADLEYLGELVRLIAEEIALYQTDLARRSRPARAAAPGSGRVYENIVGRSGPMIELCRLLDKVVDSDSTVLVHGENGTGKELIAEAIHHHSRRRSERFVVQNCSAFNDNLLDSELFGHKKGAFTGAIADKRGLFEVADRGTFFLDEIGDMSPALQVKLLRVLQEGTFTPVGDTEVRRVDVRIIAATNRDLKRMVDRGEFREDLYYRINVISLTVPPLRDRREDIPDLVQHFLLRQAAARRGREKRLEPACLSRLVDYAWPGNVRELENEIERLVVMAGDEPVVGEALLSPRLLRAAPAAGPASLPEAVGALERTMIKDALERRGGNKTRAAVDLGISRRNLIRKVSRYKLDRARGPAPRR